MIDQVQRISYSAIASKTAYESFFFDENNFIFNLERLRRSEVGPIECAVFCTPLYATVQLCQVSHYSDALYDLYT